MVAIFFTGDSHDSSYHAASGLPYFRGVDYFNDREYELAIEGFTDAIRFHTDDAEAYWYRGRTYGELGSTSKQ